MGALDSFAWDVGGEIEGFWRGEGGVRTSYRGFLRIQGAWLSAPRSVSVQFALAESFRLPHPGLGIEEVPRCSPNLQGAEHPSSHKNCHHCPPCSTQSNESVSKRKQTENFSIK